MSFTEGHALCCDCDACLNRGGGTPATTPPTVVTLASRLPAWRARAITSKTEAELDAGRAESARRRAGKAARTRVSRAKQPMDRGTLVETKWTGW